MTLQRFFNKIFSRNYLAAAALYSGLALLLLAAVPDQSSLRALDDECGQCEEGMVCVGNDEGVYECQCAEEE